MSAAAELMKGIAALLWVMLWIALTVGYRKQIGDILSRFRRGKGFGLELELDEKLRELSAQVIVAASNEKQPADAGAPSRISSGDKLVEELLREAGQSPRAALMLSSAEIERQLNLLGAQSGWQLTGPPGQLWSFLIEHGVVPANLAGALESFRRIRNTIVHGGEATDAAVLRALDSGVLLLKAVMAVPREVNRVAEANVALFGDPEGKVPVSDVTGLILETTTPGGTDMSKRIFPTTRTDYVRGKLVSWEWNMGRVVGPAWYRDNSSSELKEAWSGSAEFIGRHLD